MKELIGKMVIDKATRKQCKVLDATENSILIFKTKIKSTGIDSSSWYEKGWFERKFELISDEEVVLVVGMRK